MLSVTDGPNRPVTTDAPRTEAHNTTHQWNEQGLQSAGRNNVAALGPTYAAGALPPVNYKQAVRKTNATCRVGRTAQVTDGEIAAFNGGGAIRLAEGEQERLLQGALDLFTALVTLEVMNQIEWIHVSGDASNATMEGGETDGLIKWVTAGGSVVATGGSTSTPINFAERFIQDGARAVAVTYPALQPNKLLIAPELIPDLSAVVASGASRPLVQVANANNVDLVGGAQVGWYNTGYSMLKVATEPYLSPAFNSTLPQAGMIAYNTKNVLHAELVKLNAEQLARTDTGLRRMVTTEFAQEHRIAKHCFYAPNVKSAIL
jgi:hypothetical protein